jgi:triacylglycerol esterase/lipase EstA (alpha/beta hydrolase family)
MLRLNTLVTVAVLTIVQVQSQTAPSITWQRALGGSAEDGTATSCMRQTSDGGYIIATRTMSTNGDVTGNHGGWDAWLVKLSSAGNLIWQRALGGTGTDEGYSVMETTDGGFVMTGTTNSNDGDVSGNHGDYDAWVVKVNSTGSLQWQRALGGTGFERLQSVRQTSDGGYILTGNTASFDGDVVGNDGGNDLWVVKLNNAGSLVWQKTFGGTGSEQAFSVMQTNDGGYVVAGFTTSNDGDVTGFHGGGTDLWVIKLNGSGALVWQKALGGSGSDEGARIQQTSDGGYIVVGTTTSNNGDASGNHGGKDIWVVKLNATGSLVWQKELGSTTDDLGSWIQETNDGSFILVGRVSANDGDVSGAHMFLECWVAKVSSAGSLLWQRALGGNNNDGGQYVEQATDGGYAVLGYTASSGGDVSGNHGGWDAWAVKLAADGGGGCSATLTPSSAAIPVGGGSYSVGLSIGAGCSWTVAGIPSWITWNSPTAGAGPTTFNYTVAPNGLQSQRSIALAIAGQSVQVTQAGIAPTVSYSLTVSTKPSTALAFNEKILGTAVSGAPLTTPVKICADGTKSTILRVQASGGSVNMSNVLFRMKSGSPDIDRYCRIQTGDYDPATATEHKAKLTHPSYLANADSPFLLDTIEVYDSTSPSIPLVRVPVQVHRAPVTFVHGLWGNMDAFQDMDNQWISYFGYPNIATYRVDYTTTNARGFSTNASVVPNGIHSTVGLARYRNFSCGAVDLVCHSMGGVLARLYLRDNDLYRGDIHTLTTINTPNAGTQAADLLRSLWGVPISAALALNFMPVGHGAVDDLKSLGSYFGACHNLCASSDYVPTLNFSSSSGPAQAVWDERDWRPFIFTYEAWSHIFPLLNVLNDIDDGYTLAQALYSPEIGFDPIVPRSSQTGGLGSIHRSEVIHTEAEKDSLTIADLRFSLGTNPTSQVFNHMQFQPVPLETPWWLDIVPGFGNFAGFAPVSDSVVITSPSNDANYSAGDAIDVIIDNSSGDRHFLACMVGNQLFHSISNQASGETLAWSTAIPTICAGGSVFLEPALIPKGSSV